jgi:RNA polymerase sigma factor (sigma-70 family)
VTVSKHASLAERFDAARPQLRMVAYRMLGSAAEAEDAVQEAWLRLSRSTAAELRPEELVAWLRTTVTRICLDALRTRKSRREDAFARPIEQIAAPSGSSPEDDVVLADSLSRALLVVLDTLGPTERIAFVLHDMFAVPFDEIARVVGRSPVATKKLASRARHKVKGAPAAPAREVARQRQIVSAFLTAARTSDLQGLLAVLDPDVVRRSDPIVVPPGGSVEVRGAKAVADGTVALASRAKLAELALINGQVGIIVAPNGRLAIALTFRLVGDRIAEYDVIAEPARLRRLRLGVLDQL